MFTSTLKHCWLIDLLPCQCWDSVLVEKNCFCWFHQIQGTESAEPSPHLSLIILLICWALSSNCLQPHVCSESLFSPLVPPTISSSFNTDQHFDHSHSTFPDQQDLLWFVIVCQVGNQGSHLYPLRRHLHLRGDSFCDNKFNQPISSPCQPRFNGKDLKLRRRTVWAEDTFLFECVTFVWNKTRSWNMQCSDT